MSMIINDSSAGVTGEQDASASVTTELECEMIPPVGVRYATGAGFEGVTRAKRYCKLGQQR